MRIPALTSAFRRFPAGPPRFSLRSLLAIVTIVTLALGWYVPKVQTERRAAEAIRAAGGNVIYDWQVRPEDCPPDYRPDPPGPNFIRAWFGPHWFDLIAIVQLNRDRPRYGKNRFELIAPHLLRLAGLQRLRLEMVELDDECYRTIGRLRNLESLSLRFSNELTPENAEEIANLNELRELRLRIAHVSPVALRELVRLRKLVKLDISCNGFDPQTGREIDEYRLGDDAAAAIGEFGNLRKLTLYTTSITDAGVAHLCRNSQLEWLAVGCPLATSASFAEVTKLSQLRHLATWGWKIDNDDIEQLATLPKLESLGLGTPSVTDESVPYILRLPHIRELRLTGDGITDASLHHFQQFGDLERLDLYHTAVNKLSPAAKDLQAALPNCNCVLPRTPEEEARHRRWKISLNKIPSNLVPSKPPVVAKSND